MRQILNNATDTTTASDVFPGVQRLHAEAVGQVLHLTGDVATALPKLQRNLGSAEVPNWSDTGDSFSETGDFTLSPSQGDLRLICTAASAGVSAWV